jgi:hypothetical protein
VNTLIQPQTEVELTDEQLVSISGGIGHEREEHDHDRGRWGDDDDRRRGNRWDDDDRGRWGYHGHWVWNRWRQEWVWV